MLGFLFRRLTTEKQRGHALFDRATAIAREPHWYVEGKLPDTLDGRFAVLATVIAIVMVRLERDGPSGDEASVSLAERFIEVMESEHRELGLGDPTLGKTVRKLVGMLAQRTELWRQALPGNKKWDEVTCESLYRNNASPEALRHSADALKNLEARLQEASLADVEQGRF